MEGVESEPLDASVHILATPEDTPLANHGPRLQNRAQSNLIYGPNTREGLNGDRYLAMHSRSLTVPLALM